MATSFLVRRLYCPVPYRRLLHSNRAAQSALFDKENRFGFLKSNRRSTKPRKDGLTEIVGAYNAVVGKNYVSDLLETLSTHIDGMVFSGGSFLLYPEAQLREIIEMLHAYDVYVSAGGFLERVLTTPDTAATVSKYLDHCKDLGFDQIEVSSSFLSLPTIDSVRLVEKIHSVGMRALPELVMQHAAGAGAVSTSGFPTTRSVKNLIKEATTFLNAGAERVLIGAEGITRHMQGERWNTEIAQDVVAALGLEKTIFEAPGAEAANLYVREFGKDVNLLINHTRTGQVACLRAGLWGMRDTWGRVVSYQDSVNE